MINLTAIIKALAPQSAPPLDLTFSQAVIDSRQAVDNSLFIALPGEHVNGNAYVRNAFENGASVAIVDQDMPADLPVVDLRSRLDPDWQTLTLPLCLRVADSLTALQTIASAWREAHPLRVIGITGSVGKTSTKELTAELLAHHYTILKNPGNRNNEIGLPLTLLSLDKTHQCAVLEMGFYVPGEIRTLCDIAQPQVGVITNVGTVHAERAGSQEVIAQGKAELVEALPADPHGVAILNSDDPFVSPMRAKTSARVMTYSARQAADLTASEIRSHGLAGISCVFTHQGTNYPITSPLLGEFSVYTLLRATAVALVEGLSWDTIQHSLAVSRVDLRMRPLTLPNQITVIDDTYNAAPESTLAALELLSGLSGRRVAILGDMMELGQYEEKGHQSVGESAAAMADLLILVGARSQITARAALSAGMPKNKVVSFENSDSAAESIAQLVAAGDTILIKGSHSMQMDRILRRLEEIT